MNALRRFWSSVTGKTRVESAEQIEAFYSQLTTFRAEIKADHDRIESKLEKIDKQSKRINEIFSNLGRDDGR